MKKSVFTAALIAATLSVGVIATLLEIPNWWTKIVLSVPVRAANGPRARYWPALAALALAWVFWAWVFFVYWRQGDRYTQFGRMIRGLLGGSVLEVFIATGVQAFTYKRDDCYCCRGSYTGLVFGGTALLWAFGPGVALLFARERYRQHKLLPLCLECGYDLRGTLAAGRDTCPECGAAITHAQLPTGDEPPSPLPPFPPST